MSILFCHLEMIWVEVGSKHQHSNFKMLPPTITNDFPIITSYITNLQILICRPWVFTFDFLLGLKIPSQFLKAYDMEGLKMDLLDVYMWRDVGLLQLCIIIKHLYLSGIWLHVNLSMSPKLCSHIVLCLVSIRFGIWIYFRYSRNHKRVQVF